MFQYFEREHGGIKVNEITTHSEHPFSSLPLLLTFNTFHHPLTGYQDLATEEGKEREEE